MKMEKGPHKCPVCGMMVGDQWSAEYEGKTYYFCGKMCKDKFDASPHKYMKM